MQMSLFSPGWAAEVCNIVTTGLELGTGDGEWRRVEHERETLSISLPPLGVTAGARQPH